MYSSHITERSGNGTGSSSTSSSCKLFEKLPLQTQPLATLSLDLIEPGSLISHRESIVDKDHLPVQDAEANQLLYDMLRDPGNHMLHPKRFSNSIACSTLWGVRSPTIDTPHMKRLYDLMENWSVVMEPGNTPPVDIFPFLHWIPESVFDRWRSRASNVGDEMNGLYSDMLKQIEARREKVGSRGCFMDRVLDQQEKLELNRHQTWFLVRQERLRIV